MIKLFYFSIVIKRRFCLKHIFRYFSRICKLLLIKYLMKQSSCPKVTNEAFLSHLCRSVVLPQTNPIDTGNSMKKCRARYGLDQQNQWCKPCRWVSRTWSTNEHTKRFSIFRLLSFFWFFYDFFYRNTQNKMLIWVCGKRIKTILVIFYMIFGARGDGVSHFKFPLFRYSIKFFSHFTQTPKPSRSLTHTLNYR